MGTVARRELTVAVVVGTLLLAACQSDYRASAKQVSDSLQAGQYQQAADGAAEYLEKARGSGGDQDDEAEKNEVVALLEAARTAQVAGDLQASLAHYEAADALVRPYLDTKPDALVSEVVAATLVNQTTATYRATPGERIMLSTLLAVNRMAAGDLSNARIDLNRAEDWQQAALERYQDEIQKQQAALSSASAREGRNVGGVQHAQLSALAQSVEDRRGYADFANPFSTYLRGVFLLATSTDAGDLSNARTDLRNCLSMVPETAPVVETDLAWLEAAQRGQAAPATWVFVMSGLAPFYEELRLDIPIPVGNVNYVSAAFPVFKPGLPGVSGFGAQAADTQTHSVLLCDMDEIVGREYQLRLPGVIVQEVASSAAKAAATWAASTAARSGGNDNAAALLMIAGWIYQAASTAADLRCWRSLPQRIDVARLETPTDGVVNVLGSDGSSLCHVTVDVGRNNIVVVTLPTAGAPPAIQVARLAGSSQQPPVATVARRAAPPTAAPEPAAMVQHVVAPPAAADQPAATAAPAAAEQPAAPPEPAPAPAAVARSGARSASNSSDRGKVVRVRPGNSHSTQNSSGGPR